jgi:hypothetical protein
MKAFAALLLLSLMLVFADCSQPHRTSRVISSELTQQSDFIPREVLVKFRDSTSHDRILALIHEFRLETVKYFERLDLYEFRILSDRPVEEVIQRLSSLPEVEYAEPNYQRKAMPQGD